MKYKAFINCPFDEEYRFFERALTFICIYFETEPCFTKDIDNNNIHRLDKLVAIIRESEFSIHDLSRCKCKCQDSTGPEFYRMNMPFELGLDYAYNTYSGNSKNILLLENQQRDLQAALSDSLGLDPKPYDGDVSKFFKQIRDWFFSAKQFENRKILDSITLNEKFAVFNKSLIGQIMQENRKAGQEIFNEMGIIEYKRKVVEYWKSEKPI